MVRAKRLSLFGLRLAIGWLFFYAGYTKVVDASWSAAGYLQDADTFSGFYTWLASPANIGWVNTLNAWGLTLIGLALMFGFATRLTIMLATVMMLLYYFPALDFPHVGHGYLVDEHIIYILAFGILSVFGAGKYWGLDALVAKALGKKKLVRKFFSG